MYSFEDRAYTVWAQRGEHRDESSQLKVCAFEIVSTECHPPYSIADVRQCHDCSGSQLLGIHFAVIMALYFSSFPDVFWEKIVILDKLLSEAALAAQMSVCGTSNSLKSSNKTGEILRSGYPSKSPSIKFTRQYQSFKQCSISAAELEVGNSKEI